jgi:type VI protein secretion system component VasF
MIAAMLITKYITSKMAETIVSPVYTFLHQRKGRKQERIDPQWKIIGRKRMLQTKVWRFLMVVS